MSRGPSMTHTDLGGGGTPPPPSPGVTLLIFCDGAKAVALGPEQSLTVGRREPADVRVPDATLSSEHARFSLVEGQVVVEDLRSKNGTWIAKRRISRDVVKVGGEVMLG